jgi:hypothetical protein
MATLYIAEFSGIAPVRGPSSWPGPNTGAPIAGTPPITEQTVTIGSSSTQSAAVNAKTMMVRVHTDAICSIAFGNNPTAVATNMRLAANQTEYFGVTAPMKIAVITNT